MGGARVMKGLLLIVALAAALCHAQYQTTMVFANATCEPTIFSSLMRWNSILADSCTPQPCEEVDGVWRQVVCDTTARFPPGFEYIGWEQYMSHEACKSGDRSGTNVISANYWRNGLCFDDVRAQCVEPGGSSPAVQFQSWLTGGNTCPGNPASVHTVVDTCTAPGTTGDTLVQACPFNTPGRFRTVRVQDGEQCSASQPAVAVYQEAGPLCNTQQCLTSAGYALNVTCSTDKTFPDTNGLEVVLRTYGPGSSCSGESTALLYTNSGQCVPRINRESQGSIMVECEGGITPVLSRWDNDHCSGQPLDRAILQEGCQPSGALLVRCYGGTGAMLKASIVLVAALVLAATSL